MKHYIIFTVAIFLSHAAFAVDLDHWFNTNSITTKPVRSDYSSDEAYAADSAVYGIPRTCTWITRGYTDVNEGSISDFQLGNNLRKSRTGSWYAITVKPRFAGSSLRGFIYVNGDTGAIACGEDHLKYQGGSWSDGKWYKTFDLVLKTSHTGVTGSTSRSTTQPATQRETMPSKQLCYLAVKVVEGVASWENREAFKSDVNEAKSRGLSPDECARLTGEVVKADTLPRNDTEPNSTTKRLQKLKKLFDLGLINSSDYNKKKREILKGL